MRYLITDLNEGRKYIYVEFEDEETGFRFWRRFSQDEIRYMMYHQLVSRETN